MKRSEFALFVALLAGCVGASPPGGPAANGATTAGTARAGATSGPGANAANGSNTPNADANPSKRRVTRPGAEVVPTAALLTVEQTRKYLLALINRDRGSEGVPDVELEEGAAQAAAQEHAEDMAHRGYLGHWGSDGSVPEERSTRHGGVHMVMENALCFVDEKTRTLDQAPMIAAKDVLEAERLFFEEKPPQDGHRKNILKPYHLKVGLGVAQPAKTSGEIAGPCIVHEFVDAYGTYEPLPKTAHVGARVRVAGEMISGAQPVGVGLARVDLPTPLPASELNRRRTYPVPGPYQMYWPPGFVTPLPLKVAGRHFEIDVPLDDHKRAGLYEVSVWVKLPNSSENVLVGLRTITVN